MVLYQDRAMLILISSPLQKRRERFAERVLPVFAVERKAQLAAFSMLGAAPAFMRARAALAGAAA